MKLLTRSDFDGLACAALLKEIGVVNSWEFAHPKDIQDGLVAVNSDVVLANVPFVEGCGLWFDHHSSELERAAFSGKYKGCSRSAPSAARVVFDYYGKDRFPDTILPMMEAVDKVDSANLTIDEIQNPTGWILLGFIMDPRTGLGRFREFSISNYQLMGKLIDCCRVMTIEQILELPDVVERVDLFFKQQEHFVNMIITSTEVDGNITITDLRHADIIYTGNRFMIYALFPNQNLSVWIVSGKGGEGCSVAVGYSIVNRGATVDVGSLLLKYGGGGHKQVGTCQFTNEEMDQKIPELLAEIKQLNV